jgi:hypothetical protein
MAQYGTSIMSHISQRGKTIKTQGRKRHNGDTAANKCQRAKPNTIEQIKSLKSTSQKKAFKATTSSNHNSEPNDEKKHCAQAAQGSGRETLTSRRKFRGTGERVMTASRAASRVVHP